ncbi:MAG: (Na+)-NQR maturation NqrM [Myxococcales bacterium]|nr:(Na+)-NQR maturation NqrM [Myxococcales bacterium]
METMLATVGLFALLMLVMAIGVIFRGKPLKGSCGGLATGDCMCIEQGQKGACALPGRGKDVDDEAPRVTLTPRTTTSGVIIYE